MKEKHINCILIHHHSSYIQIDVYVIDENEIEIKLNPKKKNPSLSSMYRTCNLI